MYDCDVLVCGLGPVGDVLAGLCAAQGLKVIAVDRAADIHPLPRAAVFDHEAMRVFQALGVAERIIPLCRVPDRYEFLTRDGELLLRFDVAQRTLSGWAETYALHQPAVERTLRDRLAALGVETRTSTELKAFSQDDRGVTAELSGPNGCYEVRARYMAGCDGAWSLLRTTIGSQLFDYGFDEPWLVLDTIVEDLGDLPVACQQICDPRRPVTYMTMSGKRARWEFMLRPGEAGDELLRDDSIAELLARWNCADRIQVERKAVYNFHALVADRWRDRRVLLLGDAAHQMPPFAGQGMCSGIRDAANLAWKLAAVIRGAAPDLLDSYQAEREPHVRTIIETAIAMGRVVCILDEAAAAARDAEMLERKRRGEQDISVVYPGLRAGLLSDTPLAGETFPQAVVNGSRLDDALGPVPALIGFDLPAVSDTVKVFDIGKGALPAFASFIRDWLEDAGAGSVLVRPDRYIFGVGDPRQLLVSWRLGLGLAQPASISPHLDPLPE